MKNGIYRIEFKTCDYDEYDAFVIIACSEVAVFDLISSEHKPEFNSNLRKDNIEKIEKIGETELPEQIVLSSYNAG